MIAQQTFTLEKKGIKFVQVSGEKVLIVTEGGVEVWVPGQELKKVELKGQIENLNDLVVGFGLFEQK
jgi:hypothetical protein